MFLYHISASSGPAEHTLEVSMDLLTQDLLVPQAPLSNGSQMITVTFGNLYLQGFISYWPITVLLLTWLSFDWKIPEQSLDFLCEVVMPVEILLKTHNLSPNHNYILVCHCHGLSKLFSGITISHWVPVLRDYILSIGTCSVSHSSMDFLLTHRGMGNMLVEVVGGLDDCKYSVPNSTTLFLKNWNGFILKALGHGASLIPTYSFGETDLYDQHIFTLGGFIKCFWKWFQIGSPLSMPSIENPSQELVAKYLALKPGTGETGTHQKVPGGQEVLEDQEDLEDQESQESLGVLGVLEVLEVLGDHWAQEVLPSFLKNKREHAQVGASEFDTGINGQCHEDARTDRTNSERTNASSSSKAVKRVHKPLSQAPALARISDFSTSGPPRSLCPVAVPRYALPPDLSASASSKLGAHNPEL
ncbi:Acyl-CoA wax alcohol acyltransferase 2 [Galemys pyrenaicus]|uniref:Acyltransferase n=1 Tax=Galemys pyrenaicus TaxID=202257 RepID=A0A8J5ZYW4_GALPY|nr:Acyl-CoA wax alcohol acyltransferase 2 [Galemys pyrenaicus]